MAAIEDFLADASDGWTRRSSTTRHEFNTVRTGRASAALLDRITLDYYGTPTPLKNMATISGARGAAALRAAVRPDADHARSRRRSRSPTSA